MPDIILSQDVKGQVKHIQCQKVVCLVFGKLSLPVDLLAMVLTLGQYCQVTELLTTTFKERETKFYLGVPFTASTYLQV